MNKHIGVSIVFFFSFSVTLAELPHMRHVPAEAKNFRFLVIGDWGREGRFGQSAVAYQMGEAAKRLDIEFVISTGDNFYEKGLTGEDDITFENSFTKVYNQESLRNPRWYVVLGNHDYFGNITAQLSPVLREKDSRWICPHRSYVVTTGVADFFFVDTTPIVSAYFGVKGRGHWDNMPDRTEYISDLINDLDLAMKTSNATWKIVVGHHTIVSSGEHGATKDVVKLLEPTLLKYDVDFYINGHDHCLQNARKPMVNGRPNDIQFVTSGGGSTASQLMPTALPEGEISEFYYGEQGFMMAEISRDKRNHNFGIVFFDIDGRHLHGWSTSKQLS